jgi:tetratricopeptide (TPR) repeat protein
MAENSGSWAAGKLVDEAWAAYRGGRLQQALAAADRAIEAAEQLDDLVLLVRALEVQGAILRITGDATAALGRYTKIMALTEDPASSSRLDHPLAAQAIADAYCSWVAAARFVAGIPVRELFRVLDVAERWLTATGHRDWRANILLQRAMIHNKLDEIEAAVAAAEEALALAIQHPNAPGYSLNSFHYQFADILMRAARAAEAKVHYQAVLDDPDVDPWERCYAHEGLARCAMAAKDLGAARREARTAVLLAEPLGDDTLCISLDVLAAACLADGDLEAAWQAAIRYHEAADRIGSHYRLYFAVRLAADVALDRADLSEARRLSEELAEHAVALDTDTGGSTFASETAQRRRRLADLTAAHNQQEKADQ